jgi:hypothetical protein
VAAAGDGERPRTRDSRGLVRLAVAVALAAAFLAVFWRLLTTWDDITGAAYGCNSDHHSSNFWVPGALALLAGAGLYTLITPPHRWKYLVWSIVFAVALGASIYVYAASFQLGACLS